MKEVVAVRSEVLGVITFAHRFEVVLVRLLIVISVGALHGGVASFRRSALLLRIAFVTALHYDKHDGQENHSNAGSHADGLQRPLPIEPRVGITGSSSTARSGSGCSRAARSGGC